MLRILGACAAGTTLVVLAVATGEGPAHWYWELIRTRMFGGDRLMMAIFGLQIFLAPVVASASLAVVVHGAASAMRRPGLPEGVLAAGSGTTVDD